jgi:hypothetical protein
MDRRTLADALDRRLAIQIVNHEIVIATRVFHPPALRECTVMRRSS